MDLLFTAHFFPIKMEIFMILSAFIGLDMFFTSNNLYGKVPIFGAYAGYFLVRLLRKGNGYFLHRLLPIRSLLAN